MIGIDEAGFGPTLGPLVIAGVAFRVEDGVEDHCLWKTLGASCTSRVRSSERKIIVADSKKMHRSRGNGASLTLLERTALVMLAVQGHRPRQWRDLLHLLAPAVPARLKDYPWYADADFALPLSSDAGEIGIRANGVRIDCLSHRVEPLATRCDVWPEGHYNRVVRKTRNKATALMGFVMELLERLLEDAEDSEDSSAFIMVDRIGGRMHYREPLMLAMPDWNLRILEESAPRSAYRLSWGHRTRRIEFVTDGDRSRFPIALASIYAKYVRELFMHVFNGYWSGLQQGLKPTAGYYTDAIRWLAEAGPLLRQLRIDRNLLVRER